MSPMLPDDLKEKMANALEEVHAHKERIEAFKKLIPQAGTKEHRIWRNELHRLHKEMVEAFDRYLTAWSDVRDSLKH
jgi:hypothetical protein